MLDKRLAQIASLEDLIDTSSKRAKRVQGHINSNNFFAYLENMLANDTATEASRNLLLSERTLREYNKHLRQIFRIAGSGDRGILWQTFKRGVLDIPEWTEAIPDLSYFSNENLHVWR